MYFELFLFKKYILLMYCKCSYLRVVVIYISYVVNIKLDEIFMRMEKIKILNERVFNYVFAYLIFGGIVCL